ncbi:MAG: DNA polymerase III subunit delta [Phycisphaeraceae bacterium]|nr:DNA polymerase III subunit delta [Phycisphaerae bacterium]MBX3391323.1 DNA polymerase III subunit delta [Phycisphaeraceae bacterium]
MARKATPTRGGDGELGAQRRVIVLKGSDAFQRWLRTNEIRSALAAAHGSFDTFQFDGETARVTDVLDECRTFGLMAGHKLVIVDAADKLIRASAEDDPAEASSAPVAADMAPAAGARRGVSIDTSPRGLMTRYAQSPAEGTTLVLRASGWRPGNLDKAILATGGAIVECNELSDDRAAGWAISRARSEHRADLRPDAAALLVERLGPDLGRLDGEIAKLSISSAGGPVTRDQVAASVGHTREEEAWSIQRVLLTGDATRILDHLRVVLEVSRHSPTQVTWSCTDLARKLHAASVASRARMPAAAIAASLKLWGESKDAVLSAAGRTTPAAASRLLGACVEADARQKTGAADPRRLLEVLGLRFARIGTPARSR